MTSSKICFFYSLLLLIISEGCKKNVEVDPPITQLATSSVFVNNTTATAAQLVLYSQMRQDPYSISRMTGLSSDELYTYARDQTSKDLYANALIAATDGGSISIWATTYNYIYEENAILEGLNNSDLISPAVKQQLIGEAEFLRSFWYFYLTNLYGDVPLITTTDYKVNSVLPRVPQQQVYQQIIADLKSAENFLNPNYVDATDTVVTTDRVRPTKWTATSLLARIYLYSKKYDSAESRATMIINNPTFRLTSLDSVFYKNSLEAIWQIMPLSTALAANEGINFILNAAPGTGIGNSSTISIQLMNAFETGDNRKTHWIGRYPPVTGTAYFPNKYKDGNTYTGKLREYSMILRLAEQYLIRAEARAQQGNISGAGGALADLNAIRNRAGLSNYSGATDQASIITAIQHEREVELFTEAHRWFDLKRTGSVDAVMNMVTPSKGNSWKSYQQFYPIPLTDVQNSSTLVQTAGY